MGSSYCHPALKQLKEQQARFAPGDERLAQIDRAETLLGEIHSEKQYPYEYLWYRIKGVSSGDGPRAPAGREWGPARPSPVHRGPVGHGGPDGRAGGRAGPDGRCGEPTVQRVDPHDHAVGGGRGWWPGDSSSAGGPRWGSSSRASCGSLTRTATRSTVAPGFRQLTDGERDEIIRRARRMAQVDQAA